MPPARFCAGALPERTTTRRRTLSGCGPGIDDSRKLVGDALSQAMRLPKNASNQHAEQIRSLLADAAQALRSDARTRSGHA